MISALAAAMSAVLAGWAFTCAYLSVRRGRPIGKSGRRAESLGYRSWACVLVLVAVAAVLSAFATMTRVGPLGEIGAVVLAAAMLILGVAELGSRGTAR